MTHTVAPSRARTVVAVLLAAVITSGVVQACGGDDAQATSFERQPADAETPNPFMEGINTAPGAQDVGDPVASTSTSTPATTAPAEPATTAAAVTLPPGANASVAGDTPGLYGGSQNTAVCDATKMAAFLKDNPEQAAAWAGVLGIKTSDIPNYIALLTATTLRTDTAVTNHGYKNGKATKVPAVLQAGTAVFVNDRGVPVVKCNCGNPLTPPANRTDATFSGPSWKGFSPRSVATVRRSPDRLNDITLVNITNNTAFTRPVGTDGDADVPYVREPEDPTGRPDDGEGTTTTTAAGEDTTTTTTPADDTTTTTTTTAPAGETSFIDGSVSGTGGDCVGIPSTPFEARIVDNTGGDIRIVFSDTESGMVASDGTFSFDVTGPVPGAPGSTVTTNFAGRVDQGPPWQFTATRTATITNPSGTTFTCISTYTGARRGAPVDATTTTSTTTTSTTTTTTTTVPPAPAEPTEQTWYYEGSIAQVAGGCEDLGITIIRNEPPDRIRVRDTIDGDHTVTFLGRPSRTFRVDDDDGFRGVVTPASADQLGSSVRGGPVPYLGVTRPRGFNYNTYIGDVTSTPLTGVRTVCYFVSRAEPV